MKDKLIEEYIINPCTMIIMPEEYGSKNYSKIYELENEFLSPFKPLDIIKASCDFYCSSYEGRVEGSYNLIGKAHKAPIAIDPTNSLFFFPTTSPSRPDCIWVSDQHVINYHHFTSISTKVIFRNRKTYDIPTSSRVFKNQLLKTALLRIQFMQRINENERMRHLFLSNPKYMSASEKMNEYGKAEKKKKKTPQYDD